MTLVVQMQNAGTTSSDPLLSYTVTTTPSPLKASPENPTAPEEIGEIIIAVARQSGTPADLKSIRLKVPAGTMSPDLATDLAKITPRISLTGWSVHLEAAAKEFVFTPTASHTPIGPETGFTIQLSDIPVSRKVGTAPITLTESSRTGTSAFQDREAVFNIGKFPADFYMRNFLCEPSIIANGGDVELTWERSANAKYDLLYPGVERDVTDRTSLRIEGIKSDTTFYLRATTGDPTNPVTRILSAQVTVIKPDLELGNLTVHEGLQLTGPASAMVWQRIQYSEYAGGLTTTAGTDGFLVVDINTRGCLKVYSQPRGSVLVESTFDPELGKWVNPSATFPVVKGSEVSIEIVKAGQDGAADVVWFSLGGVKLEV
ncbi:hypothetical protein ACFW7J_09625 [Streptomyces sp. NPDC059525]|uniref:hypothetical protein n=1 Tax=Streptomyces sp. NPDC059525 TaxID=3346857 RepID=UPI003674A89A